MMAGETLFFNIIFRDKSGAEIDELDDFTEARIKLKVNGKAINDKQVKWKLIPSEFGDHSIKATFYIADHSKVQVYLDDYLLPFEVDLKIIARVKSKKIENIHSDYLHLDITESYAHPPS